MTGNNNQLMTHKDRVAVVTGAAAGIGQAVAVGLARRGAKVVGIDIAQSDETARLVEAAGGHWLGLNGDVSAPNEVGDVCKTILAKLGKCDILINNAGIFPARSFDDLTFEEWQRVLSINLNSQFLMSKAIVPSMKTGNWGRIVNLTSNSVQVPGDDLTAYKASKMGSIGLTRGMAADLGRFGITVNAISPSLTRTKGVMEYGAAHMLDMAANMQAIKRVAEPADIVGLMLFLTSDDAEFVTGQTIFADGGIAYS